MSSATSTPVDQAISFIRALFQTAPVGTFIVVSELDRLTRRWGQRVRSAANARVPTVLWT